MALILIPNISSGGGSGITQLTGDGTAGPGSGSQALTLATVNATTGAFTNANITVNAKGLITAAANGAAGGGITGPLTGDVTTIGAGGTVTTLANIPNDTPAAGDLLITAIAAPATPAAGKARIYIDSTAKCLTTKNDAGTVSHAVQTKAAVASNWIRSIADDGSSALSQPAFTDISGAATTAQLGTNTASNTVLAQMAANTVKMNNTGATANAADVSTTNLWTNAQRAQMATLTIKGNNTGGTANEADLTAAQTKTLLAVAFTDVSGTATTAQIPDVVIGVQVITASGTYTATAGTKSQIVEGWGSGGGGGGTTLVATSTACGGGGAAGGYFRRKYAIVGGGTGTVAIGVAGTAGAATGANGGTGGNTTFTDGTTLCTAFGGLGGLGMTGGQPKSSAGGAAGAISTNGTLNATGWPGGPGLSLAATIGVSGNGGSCMAGGGGVGSTAQGAGAAGTGHGSGGAGGTTINGGAAVTGGAGTQGIVVITEFA